MPPSSLVFLALALWPPQQSGSGVKRGQGLLSVDPQPPGQCPAGLPALYVQWHQADGTAGAARHRLSALGMPLAAPDGLPGGFDLLKDNPLWLCEGRGPGQ